MKPPVFLAVVWLSLSCTGSGQQTTDAAMEQRPVLRVTVPADTFPNGSYLGLQALTRDAVEPVSFVVDGITVGAIRKWQDGGTVSWSAELPPQLAEGFHSLGAADREGRSAGVTFPLRHEGIFDWAIAEGFTATACAGPFRAPSGARIVACAYSAWLGLGDNFGLSQHVLTGTPAHPEVKVRFKQALAGFPVFFPYVTGDARNGVEPLAFMERSEKGALVFSAAPSEWTLDSMPIARSARFPTITGCGISFWHSGLRTKLLIAGRELVSVDWPLSDGAQPVPILLEGGTDFCGVSAADLDGDGTDELVTSYYRDGRWGLSIFRGDVEGEMNRILETHSVEFAGGGHQQAVASFGDIDGDGLLDLASTSKAGGVDVVFTNGDGSFDLRRDLVPSTGVSPHATTIARLGPERRSYLIVANGHEIDGRALDAWSVVGRHEALDESWRFPSRGYLNGNTIYPMLVFDADDDGLTDLVGYQPSLLVMPWRQPEVTDGGLSGPRRPTVERIWPSLIWRYDAGPVE